MENGTCILVVDDTAENIDLLSGLLSPHYQVKVANSGARALKIAASETPPDLILLDVMMPEMDGYEVCRRLKADERTRGIPIIFVTARGEVTDEQAGFELGAVDYLVKPVSPPIVLARVKNTLNLIATQKRLQEALDETLVGSVELLMDVLSMINPVAFGRSRNLRRHAAATAARLGKSNTWTFEVAAMLSQLGSITLPQELLERIYAGESVSRQEMEIFRKHPEVGSKLLRRIPNLQDAAEIIALQNSDLNAIAERHEEKPSDNIMLGASLLQVALNLDDQDRRRQHELLSAKPRFAKQQEQQAAASSAKAKPKEGIREILFTKLAVGMILGCDIRTKNEMLLAKKETEVTKMLLERLLSFERSGMLSVETVKVLNN